jgi:hypothetical protein
MQAKGLKTKVLKRFLQPFDHVTEATVAAAFAVDS